MKLSVKEVCKEKGLTIQDLADKMEMKRERCICQLVY